MNDDKTHKLRIDNISRDDCTVEIIIEKWYQPKHGEMRWGKGQHRILRHRELLEISLSKDTRLIIQR